RHRTAGERHAGQIRRGLVVVTAIAQLDADAAVEGDGVAEDAVGCDVVHQHAVARVGERPSDGRVGANEIALNQIVAVKEVVHIQAEKGDAVAAVGRQHVAGNGVVKRRVYANPVGAVAQWRGAGDIGADEVALYQVVGRAGAEAGQFDADAPVTGDHV